MWSVTRLSSGVLALVHTAVRGVLRAHVRAHYMAQLVPAAHAVHVNQRGPQSIRLQSCWQGQVLTLDNTTKLFYSRAQSCIKSRVAVDMRY